MRIITRYILREHLGPLLFALTALTSLLLLQYVAKQLDKLVGKGLPWGVIGEFVLLSLPFTVAMTLPMAVLVSTLHAFGRLASENEVTAFKASGIRVRSLMAPVLGASAILSVLMVIFNDQVLPQANHRLANLLADIINVRPTVGLREQVITRISDNVYMRVGWIDDVSNRMRDVEIWDLQNTMERSSVYADSGTFTLSPDSADLQLVLYDGQQLQFPEGDTKQLRRTIFRQQVLKVRNMAQGFSAGSGSQNIKSEREQSICELQAEYAKRSEEYEVQRQRWIAQLRYQAAEDDSVLSVPKQRPTHGGLAEIYCTKIPALFLPKEAEAAVPNPGAQDTITPRPRPGGIPDIVLPPSLFEKNRRDSIAAATGKRSDSLPPSAGTVQEQNQPAPQQGGQQLPTTGPDGLPLPMTGPDGLPATIQPQEIDITNDSLNAERARQLAVPDSVRPPPAMLTVTPELLRFSLMEMNKYSVEVQKKFALSMACFVFVLFGPPIALRFPRGGVGVTIGVSLVVFGAYYICLMAGEALADKGRLDPVVAMWGANVIFTIAGILLLLRAEKTTDGSRGGGFLTDWWYQRKAKKQLAAASSATSGARA